MLRSCASSSARTASKSCGTALCRFTPPSRAPTPALASPAPPNSIRTFTASPRPRARGGPVKLLPEWSWRTPYKHYGRPVVELVSNADDADAVLETITSRRVSIDAEPGRMREASEAASSSGISKWSSVKDGTLAVVDAEGVVRFYRDIFQRFDYYRCEPTNMLCLRRLAEVVWPYLSDDAAMLEQNPWLTKLARERFGVRFTVHDAAVRDYHVKKLQPAKVDMLVNSAWFTHVLGAELRPKLLDKIERDAARVPAPDFMRQAAVEKLEKEVYRAITIGPEELVMIQEQLK
ncbi:hypothetical protein Rhopal_003853-T1 [Rhodotorula paludigena]|uniref:Uncharacterized protein n=1 Tax=Rhodotorula paludigena TaxID=86838 RepID=A0AAV5GLQ6_9BASI|nr:hypothetical protein Rhopal_003853-T1 [Rhodotorula paludigena]